MSGPIQSSCGSLTCTGSWATIFTITGVQIGILTYSASLGWIAVYLIISDSANGVYSATAIGGFSTQMLVQNSTGAIQVRLNAGSGVICNWSFLRLQ